MSFLYRPRSIHGHKNQKESIKSSAPIPLLPAIENVPTRSRTTSAMGASHIIRRVSSIFLSKKKPLPDIKLANSLVNHHFTPSFSSSRDSIDSEDDIRRPSGLGRAVSIMSNRSLPPSPFMPHSPTSPYPNQDYQRIRALSSPNLLQSFNTSKVVRQQPRPSSISLKNGPLIESELTPLPLPPPSPASCLPKEVMVGVLSYLSRGTIASCSQVSKSFAAAARYSLYNTLNLDSLSLLQLEQLLALVASRRDLTELVSTFICHKWPPFFISDCHCRGTPPTGYVFQQKDALLTATFTLALERMTNITSLTLPAFDASLLAHHTALGLTRLTFMNYTMSESDARALFSWLNGQTNIISLRFMNLEDVSPTKDPNTVSYRNSISGRLGVAPTSPFLVPTTQSSPPVPAVVSPFRSPILLPSLVELHATPSILTLLAFPAPQSSLPSPFLPPVLRPLTTVSLNITTTLYTGLRPATLMSPLRGISHLCLKFGSAVDRRTFEKVVGAAGGVLGGGEGEGSFQDGWAGLHSLELGFWESSPKQSRRDEVRFQYLFSLPVCLSLYLLRNFNFIQALYKALQISLPRYKSLQFLRLFVSNETSVDDHHHCHHQYQHHLERYRNDLANDNAYHTNGEHDDNSRSGRNMGNNNNSKTSGAEQILIDSWLKLCPSLEAVTLFSGAQWRRELDDREELWSNV